jgi:hypothetical protein
LGTLVVTILAAGPGYAVTTERLGASSYVNSRAQEAAEVAEAALGLAGHEVHPSTRELIAAMGRGQLTGDQAVAVIVARFVDGSPRH